MTLEEYRAHLLNDLNGLRHLGPGVDVSRRLVAKLRFERLMHGSSRAREWFERDPADFTRAFQAYRAAVPAKAWFPLEEARDFTAWLEDVPRGTP